MMRQAGFNLIEVLVALVVLTIGLLGVAQMQIQGVRFNHQSFSRSQAVLLAHDYVERMYANRPGLAAFAYGGYDSANENCNGAPAVVCENIGGTCTAPQMALYDRFIIACGYVAGGVRYGGVNNLLPAGRIQAGCIDAAGAAVACAAGLRHRVTVSWIEPTPGADGVFVEGENARTQISMDVQP